MDRNEFAAAGQALFGESWIGPLAAASGIARRSIARMAAGKAEIPADLAEPMRRAALLIADLRVVIDQGDEHPVTQRTRALLERSLNRIFET
jgi:hypothetical protein